MITYSTVAGLVYLVAGYAFGSGWYDNHYPEAEGDWRKWTLLIIVALSIVFFWGIYIIGGFITLVIRPIVGGIIFSTKKKFKKEEKK